MLSLDFISEAQLQQRETSMFEFVKLRKHKIHQFKPKVHIFSDKGPFILKTVETADELIEALRLRYQVFHRELLGKFRPTGIDVDEFDFVCDHLVIVDKKTKKIVGTYRFNSSEFSHNFYCEQEFHMENLMSRPGTKLELGRACIHSEYRRGAVIALLWRGIADYMKAINASILFGCASIKTESPRQAALLYHYFHRDGRFKEGMLCPPTAKYTMPNLDLWIENLSRELTVEEKTEIDELIPPLCRAYLKAGSLMGGEPAYDSAFKCIDFLTILPRENLNAALWRKYKPWTETADQNAASEDPQTEARSMEDARAIEAHQLM
jgi:putative hemolysin